MPFRLEGGESLKTGGPRIVAPNHASYLDAIVLTALLPPEFAYVVKREFEKSFISRIFLRRLGSIFVERFDAAQSAGETRKVLDALQRGESLVIFPEGTFRRYPGLLPFRMGTFAVAVDAGVPVVPVAIQGTRSLLRDGSWLLRHGRMSVTVAPAVRPEGSGWHAGVQLRDRVRAAILERCGEPDLCMNLHDLFAIPRRRSPEKPALRFQDGGVETVLSYGDLFAKADALAAALAARGIATGDRVAFFLGNRPEFVVAYLAVIRLGAVMVPINLAYRQREIGHMLEDSEPRLLITERARTAHPGGDGDRGSAPRRGDRKVCTATPGDSRRRPSTAAISRCSSTPRGRRGRARAPRSPTTTCSRPSPASSPPGPGSRRTRCCSPCPLFHTHGLVVGLHCALAAGATVLLRRRFEAAETASELLAGEPTLFFGVPTMYGRLVEELRRAGSGGRGWISPACACSARAARRSPPRPSPPSAS